MDAPYASIASTTGCTIQNVWVKELRYLSVHILNCSNVRLNVHYQITEKQFIARQMLSQCSTLVRNTVVRAIVQAYGKW